MQSSKENDQNQDSMLTMRGKLTVIPQLIFRTIRSRLHSWYAGPRVLSCMRWCNSIPTGLGPMPAGVNVGVANRPWGGEIQISSCSALDKDHEYVGLDGSTIGPTRTGLP